MQRGKLNSAAARLTPPDAAAHPALLPQVIVNIRMTVVKLRDGSLFVHAPVAPTKECIRLVEELGCPVKYIVLPTSAVEHKARASTRRSTASSPPSWRKRCLPPTTQLPVPTPPVRSAPRRTRPTVRRCSSVRSPRSSRTPRRAAVHHFRENADTAALCCPGCSAQRVMSSTCDHGLLIAILTRGSARPAPLSHSCTPFRASGASL